MSVPEKLKHMKVTPEVVQTIYLDEIAGRLADLMEELRLQRGEGIVEPYEIVVGPQGYLLDTNLPWISVSIFNDGPDEVRVGVNKDWADGTLKKGDKLDVNMGARVIDKIYLESEGTATVRIFAKR